MTECMYKKDCADYPKRCKDCANDPNRSYFVPKEDYPCPTPYIPPCSTYPWGTGDWWYPTYTTKCVLGSSLYGVPVFEDDD
uniref:Uncharacterized protein n=1 Tax=viral metagenome TaxID=1070528 RepID=A0A6M3L7U2_9ZZZZ